MCPAFSISGRSVPNTVVGDLSELEGRDPRRHLEQHGYLLLRGVHDAGDVLAARREVLAHLAEVGEVDAATGVATGHSRRAEMYADLGRFWRSVSEGPAVRRVVHGPRITAAMQALLGEPAAPFSFLWLRAMAAGKGSPLHVDHPYMNRGSHRLLTVWTPVGAVGLDEAPLYVVEGSHRWPALRARFEGLDVDRDQSRPGHVVEHPIDFAAANGARLLTTTFAPGDALVFGMFTAHASFDNASTAGRVRISCDTRFQPSADPMDERWSGDDPPAHGGQGYGCLSAARPLTAPLLKR